MRIKRAKKSALLFQFSCRQSSRKQYNYNENIGGTRKKKTHTEVKGVA